MNLKTMIPCLLLFLGLMTSFNYPMPKTDFPHKPGVHRMQLHCADGKIIRYVISIPTSFDKAKETPLVITLHFGGRVSPYYGEAFLNALTGPALEELGAIMVSPDCPGRGWTDPYSEKAVIALMDIVTLNYKIDKKKLLLTGFSMGGIGTWHIAANYPDRFTAIIPISSISKSKILKKIKNLPIYIINSKTDEIFKIDDVEGMVKQLKAQGLSVTFVALENTSHYHTHRFVPALKAAVPWIKKNWK